MNLKFPYYIKSKLLCKEFPRTRPLNHLESWIWQIFFIFFISYGLLNIFVFFFLALSKRNSQQAVSLSSRNSSVWGKTSASWAKTWSPSCGFYGGHLTVSWLGAVTFSWMIMWQLWVLTWQAYSCEHWKREQ